MPSEAPSGEIESLLQDVVAKQAIHDALMRYCRGIDRCDERLVLSAFHDDAVDNHTGVEMRVSERVPWALAQTRTNVKWTSHNICNELIEVDGDIAQAESYLIAYHRIEHEGKDLDWILGARYVDTFERRNGMWRIAHRTVIFDWDRFDEVRDPPSGHSLVRFFAQAEQATRSSADFSYQSLHG